MKKTMLLVSIFLLLNINISYGYSYQPLLFRKNKNEINYYYKVKLKRMIEDSEFFISVTNYPYLQIKEKYKINKKDVKYIKKINNEIYEYIVNFKNNIKNQSEEYKKRYESNDQGSSGLKFVYEAYAEYDEAYNKNNLISIPVLTYKFTGGAHGMSVLKSFNYNLKDGKELKLSDIFKDNINYKELINNYIKNQIEKRKYLYFAWEKGFNSIDENQDFYLDKDKLVIYFQLYEIAPYYVGITKFEIPLEDIKDVITI